MYRFTVPKRTSRERMYARWALVTVGWVLGVVAVAPVQAADADIVINEIMYNADGEDDDREYLELYNRDVTDVDLSGWSFSDGIAFTFPNGTTVPAHDYLVVARSTTTLTAHYGISNVVGDFTLHLGNGGERIALVDDVGTTIDTVTYDDDAPWPTDPDGGGPSLECIDPDADNDDAGNWAASTPPEDEGTPGAVNSVAGTPPVPGENDIVINEIMFNPSIAQGLDLQYEFVELYNRGTTSVALGGWHFSDGFDYTFPSTATLAAGDYLTVCADPTVFPTGSHPYGPFVGQLSNNGERVTLHTTGTVPRVVDSVEYADGWEWPKAADGTGLSLERRNPHHNDTGPGNWEAGGSEGVASLRIVATGPGNDVPPGNMVHQLVSGLPAPGPPPRPMVTVAFWARSVSGARNLQFQFIGAPPPGPPGPSEGTGRFGTIELSDDWRYYERTTEAVNQMLVFFLTGAGECLIDDVRLFMDGVDLIANGGFETASPLEWQRTGNHAGSWRDTSDARQSNFGTPGQANTCLTTEPSLPHLTFDARDPAGQIAAAQAVAITATVHTTAPLASLDLHYATDWSGFASPLTMFDDGAHGDGAAGDGVFGVTIPAQADGTLVRWYLEAQDDLALTARYPRDAPIHTESYFVLDQETSTPLVVYRAFVSPGNWTDLTTRDLYCDDEVDAFFCYGSDARQVGLRYRGGVHSRRDPTKKPYRIAFDDNRLFEVFPDMGRVEHMNLNADHMDRSCLRTALAYGLLRDGGLIVPRTQHVHLRMNTDGTHEEFMGVYTQVEAVDDAFLDRADNFNDDSGNLYKSIWTTFEDEGNDPVDYMDQFEKKTNEEENDWTDLIDFIQAVAHTPDAQFKAAMDNRIEMDSYFDYMAWGVCMGAWDNYIIFAHNFLLYHRPSTDRFFWVPWDYDETFQQQTTYLGEDLTCYHPTIPPNREVATWLPFNERVMTNPEYRYTYEQRIVDLLHHAFTEDNIHPRVDALYALIASDVQADTRRSFTYQQFEAEVALIKTVMHNRREYLLGMIPNQAVAWHLYP